MRKRIASRTEEAINKIIELTQDGKLIWQIVDHYDYLHDETRDVVLLTQYSDMHLLLYQGMHILKIKDTGSIYGEDEEVVNFQAKLSIYDPEKRKVIYTFPYSILIEDLYKAATYVVANVDQLINDLLSDEDNKDN